jgi:hypothetical protein
MRKLLISDGEGLKNFMSEFYNTLSMCIKENNKDFQLISKNFSDAFDSVKISTEKLSQRIKSNENYSALFVASDYLNLLGITAGAHYLIKGALSLKDHENRDFFESKKDMAIFFSTQILPNTVGLSKSICSEIFELETKRIDNILGGF